METPFVTPLLLVPVRKSPADAAEMVTQLLLGDTGLILEQDRQWRLIRQDRDGYEGWVDEKTVVVVSQGWKPEVSNWLPVRQDSLTCEVSLRGQRFAQNLLRGTQFPCTGETPEQWVSEIGPWRLECPKAAVASPAKLPTLADAADAYLGAPYLWGGKSRTGIDCSGLTQLCAWHLGIALPRDAWQQAQVGTGVPLAEAQRGDLAFFANAEGRITHTGILLGQGGIVHAHGYVRQDHLNETGILSLEHGRITHTLSHVMRIT